MNQQLLITYTYLNSGFCTIYCFVSKWCFSSMGWPTTVCKPSLAPAGFETKFYWNTATPIQLPIVWGHIHLPQQLVTATETLWPTKPRTFTGNLCQPMFDSNWPQALKSSQAVTYFKLFSSLCAALWLFLFHFSSLSMTVLEWLRCL